MALNANNITFLDGKVTLFQICLLLAIVFGGLYIILKVKKAIRIVIVLIMALCIYGDFALFSPKDVINTAMLISSNPVVKKQINDLCDKSYNIKYEDDKLQVKLGVKWINIDDITAVVQSSKEGFQVIVDGENIIVRDKQVQRLLTLLTQKSN